MLCACSAPREERELVVWHSYIGGEAELLAEAAQRFEDTHPGLDVRLVAIPFHAFADKVTVAVPRGNGPDLFIAAHDRVGVWADARIVEPIGFRATESLMDRFLAPTLEPLVYEGELYGLPLAFKTLALFYDKTLVERVARNSDELIAEAKRVRANNEGVWGFASPEPDSLYFHAPWLHGFGGRVYSDEAADTLALADAAATSSALFVRSLIYDEKVMPSELTSALVTALFNDHKVAYVLNGSWFKGEISHDDWGVAVLPVISATGKFARPFLTVEAVMMNRRSKRKREAFELMGALTDDDAATRRLGGGQLVANRSCYDRPDVADDAYIHVFREQASQTVALGNRPHMRQVWTPTKNALGQAIFHGAPPGEALRAAVERIDRVSR